MAISITLAGTEYTAEINFRSVRVQNSREVKGSTMSFFIRIYDDTIPPPKAGMEIIFLDGTTREFAGVIVSVVRRMKEANRAIEYECDCMDYTYYLDRRYLNKVYTAQRADLMFQEILDDLQTLSNSADLHYNDFQSAPLFKLGPSVAQQRFERILPSQAFDVIAEGSGMTWWVDYNKTVNLEDIQDRFPDFLPFVDGTPELQIDTDIANYRDLEDEENIATTGTVAIIRDAVIKATASQTDTFLFNTGDSLKFMLSRRPFSFLDITSVKANAVTLTQKLEDIDLPATDAPGTGNVAIFIGPVNGDPSYVRLDAADIADGQAVEVIYNYGFVDDSEGPAIDVVDEMAERTGGDGIHEFIFTQASEIVVSNLTDLDVILKILLDRKGKVLRRGKFKSWAKGWEAGQNFTMVWNKEAIREEVFIVNLQKIIRTPADSPSDNLIESTVTYSNVPRGANI